MTAAWRSEEGATAMEFALIAPVLILLLMAIVEGGRMFNTWLVLYNQTRETARWAIAASQTTNPAYYKNTATFQAAIQSYDVAQIGQILDTRPLSVSATVVVDGSTGLPQSVAVTSRYTLQTITPVIQRIAPSVPLSAAIVMRAE